MEHYISPTGRDTRDVGKRNDPALSIRWLARSGSLRQGDTIFFLPGTYNEPIAPRYILDGMKLKALEPETVVFRPADGRHAIEIAGRQDIEVSGMTIEAGEISFDGIKIKAGSRNILLEDLVIKSAMQNGVHISDNATGITIRRVNIRECGIEDSDVDEFRHGVYCQGDNVQILDCTADNCGGAGFMVKGKAGIDQGPQNIVVANNRVLNCDRGIGVTSTRNAQVTGNHVEDIVNAGYGVNYDDATAIFMRNTVKRANSGLRIGQRAGDVEVRNNTFMECEVGVLESQRRGAGKTVILDNQFSMNKRDVFQRGKNTPN